MAAMAADKGTISISCLLWVFFHLLAVYNLHGLMTLSQGQLFDLSLRTYYKSKLHRIILGGGLTFSFLLILLAPPILWLPLLFLNLLALIYGTPLLRFKNKVLRPKDLPLLKAPLVTIGVGSSVIFLPLFWAQGDNSFSIQAEHLILLIHLFLNVIGGDLRDLKLDNSSGVKTWPVQWGFHRVQMIAITLAILILPIGIAYQINGFFLTIMILDIALLSSLRPNQPKSLYHALDLAHFFPFLALFGTSVPIWVW